MALKKLRPDFRSEELSDKLRQKVKDFWNGYKAAVTEGRDNGQDRSYNSILGIMYPELAEYLTLPTAFCEKDEKNGLTCH